MSQSPTTKASPQRSTTSPDWTAIARVVLTSREIDRIEESELVPSGLVTYQFSARGHELAQAILGSFLDHPRDAAGVYYRSRPFVLACGLTPEEAMAATMGRSGSPNAGRDIGVVHAMPSRGGATILPGQGGVGTQYTTAVGWAAAIRYRVEVMGDDDWRDAIAVSLGGDGSTATPGFWAALNIAATSRLPMLFFIEDNGFAISVRSAAQNPGGNIAQNLAGYGNLLVLDGDGTRPSEAAKLVRQAVDRVRGGRGPALLRLSVPRLCGHSFVDTQAYKTDLERAEEESRDPLPRLRSYLRRRGMTVAEWDAAAAEVEAEVAEARDRAKAQAASDPFTATRFVFYEAGRSAAVGGTRPEGAGLEVVTDAEPDPPEPVRVNMIDAIRRTLESEMERTDRVVVFGEDVGAKGGVHGATRGMQTRFGEARVFDTSLTEEGIVGRANGMALAGLIPVAEIQFRKYADPATEQLNDLGTLRWRTAGTFAAPVVVRMPIGVSRATGDPWHSVSGESVLAHNVGWRVAIPSNASDAAGLLRTALRGDDPTYFLEHRILYDGVDARRPYPGDDYQLPFGQGALVRNGADLTIVAWGEMVHRCLKAADAIDGAVEVIDLRTIVPWDRELVLESVRKTGRCLIAHEDNLTCGFGAEIAALVAEEAFPWLDAPVARLASFDCPVPYDPDLMSIVVPTVETIRKRVEELLAF